MPIDSSNRSQLYQAYLLRLWRDAVQDSWRASIQAVGSEQIQAFTDLNALFHYLDERTDAPRRDADSAEDRAS